MNNLLNFAKGSTDTAKTRILELRNNVPTVIREAPSSEPLTICVAHNLAEQALFPSDPITIFVQSMEDAMELINI